MELNDCGINWLSTYTLCLYVLWASRQTCGTILMWMGWLCDIRRSSRSSSWQSRAWWMGWGRPVGYSQHQSQPRWNQLGTPPVSRGATGRAVKEREWWVGPYWLALKILALGQWWHVEGRVSGGIRDCWAKEGWVSSRIFSGGHMCVGFLYGQAWHG